MEEAQTRLRDEENVNGDLLLTYLVNPWTALYLGYNTNYRNELVDPGMRFSDDLFNDASQVFVKISYLFQP